MRGGKNSPKNTHSIGENVVDLVCVFMCIYIIYFLIICNTYSHHLKMNMAHLKGVEFFKFNSKNIPKDVHFNK